MLYPLRDKKKILYVNKEVLTKTHISTTPVIPDHRNNHRAVEYSDDEDATGFRLPFEAGVQLEIVEVDS